MDVTASANGFQVKLVAAEGSTDGTIALNGNDVAVHGLGSAAFEDTTAFDAAGDADAAETAAKSYADAITVNGQSQTSQAITIDGGDIDLTGYAKASAKAAVAGTDSFHRGYDILINAVAEPLKQIAENAGINGEIVLNKINEANKEGYGYNAATEQYVDMMSNGVIDTTKAIKNALINAASVAGMILTTECTITDIPKKEDNPMIMSPVGPMPM
jgi:chaperonin GroEL